MIFDKRYFQIVLSRIPLWQWVLGLVLFVAAQTAGTIHAEIHAFHEHTVFCEAFENAADPTIPDSGFVAIFVFERLQSQVLVLKLPAGSFPSFDAFQSRAPPVA